ncbi:MAG: hypothetical protein SAL70_09580 [Scytonema sp. PMC 1070.18]|nr:hypothetical protein [Scytonema sp. PMC 1070.18]
MENEYDFSQGQRGAIDSIAEGKTRITIRLDIQLPHRLGGWGLPRANLVT